MRQLRINKTITNRDSPSLQTYLKEIDTINLISVNEEVTLAREIKQGSKVALDKLVKANLRFVVSVAKQYQNQGLSLPDLVNSGNFGLIKAAQRYDETKGFKFISYAVGWIRQSILQALADEGRIVRLPCNKVGLVRKIFKFYDQYISEHGIAPTEEVIAETLDVPLDKIQDSLFASHIHTSLDISINSEDAMGDTFGSTLPSDARTDRDIDFESLQIEIKNSLTKLTEKEADAIRGHFGLDGFNMNFLEQKYGLTVERLRQLKERAIKKLQKNRISKSLRPYLGN